MLPSPQGSETICSLGFQAHSTLVSEAALPSRPMDPVSNVSSTLLLEPHHCRHYAESVASFLVVATCHDPIIRQPQATTTCSIFLGVSHRGDDGLRQGPTFLSPSLSRCVCLLRPCVLGRRLYMAAAAMPHTFSCVRCDLGAGSGPVCRWPWCVALRKHGPNKPVWLPALRIFGFATTWPTAASRRIFPAYLPISRATTTTTSVTTQRAG